MRNASRDKRGFSFTETRETAGEFSKSTCERHSMYIIYMHQCPYQFSKSSSYCMRLRGTKGQQPSQRNLYSCMQTSSIGTMSVHNHSLECKAWLCIPTLVKKFIYFSLHYQTFRCFFPLEKVCRTESFKRKQSPTTPATQEAHTLLPFCPSKLFSEELFYYVYN